MFKDDLPIYLQLRSHIEELILKRILAEEDAIPSLRVMAKDYGINPLTVSSAISLLVEEGILYRKRGIGIFVNRGARDLIINMRSKDFIVETLEPVLNAARQLEIPRQVLETKIIEVYGENNG